jgi:hypothetical protein
MKRVWQCDTCRGVSDNEPGHSPGCGKETCDSCFDRYAHCKVCAADKSDEELRVETHCTAKDCKREP